MSKRNFILLIIILVVIVIVIFGFLFFRQRPTTPIEDGGGTNFFSEFNPFGSGTTTPPVTTPPTDVSGYQPDVIPEEKPVLIKVSSMPIAGHTVYQKERLVEAPLVSETEVPTIAPYDFGTTTLKKGSAGDAVKELQRFLNNTLVLTLELDGVLDEEVVSAIKQWQNANKSVADGVVGPKTKGLMYASVKQEGPGKPTPPPTEFVPALRYVSRATGNIYQTFADKIDERKFSTTVIPKVYEALFGNRGESVVMRYLKDDGKTIETFVGNLPREVLGEDTTENNDIRGNFLPENVQDMSLSSDASKLFYLFNFNDNIVGTILDFATNKKTQVFDSAFTEWLSVFPNNKIVTLTTKPASSVFGYMYTIDPSSATSNITRTLGDINGLTTLTSPNGKLVLYADNNLSLAVFDSSTKTSELLGVRTLPEKCVWGKLSNVVYCAVPKSANAGEYPDVWYQGETSFSDQIWKIDTDTKNSTFIIDPISVKGGEEIDGIKLITDEGENYLLFVNKKDSFLWELKLK